MHMRTNRHAAGVTQEDGATDNRRSRRANKVHKK